MKTEENRKPETQFEDRARDESHGAGIGLATYVVLIAVAVIFVIVISLGFTSIRKRTIPPMKLFCREIRRLLPTRRSLRGRTVMSKAGTLTSGPV